MGKAEMVARDWDASSMNGRYNILFDLGLDYKYTRIDSRRFEDLPQKMQREIAHTAELLF